MNECLDLESRSELGNAYMSLLGVCYRPYHCPRPPPPPARQVASHAASLLTSRVLFVHA